VLSIFLDLVQREPHHLHIVEVCDLTALLRVHRGCRNTWTWQPSWLPDRIIMGRQKHLYINAAIHSGLVHSHVMYIVYSMPKDKKDSRPYRRRTADCPYNN